MIHWLSTVSWKAACICLCAHQGQCVESFHLQLLHSLLFASSFWLSIHSFPRVFSLLLACFLYLLFSLAFLFSFFLSLPLRFLSPSHPFFICCPVYSLPLSSLLSLLSFCLLCFLIFFYLSCLRGGLTETQTHMGACTDTLPVETHSTQMTNTQSNFKNWAQRRFTTIYPPLQTHTQNTHIHRHSHTVWLHQEESSFWDESLYTVFISLPLL